MQEKKLMSGRAAWASPEKCPLCGGFKLIVNQTRRAKLSRRLDLFSALEELLRRLMMPESSLLPVKKRRSGRPSHGLYAIKHSVNTIGNRVIGSQHQRRRDLRRGCH